MSSLRWITPPGVLGIVPEQEFYSFKLEAADAAGGEIEYSLVSGKLPRGLRVITQNSLGFVEGVPVSETVEENTNEYRFTIRAKNTSTTQLADRTFSLSITNVSPPVIVPKDVDLGIYLVGTVVNQQLVATGVTEGETVNWTLRSGELPNGLQLTDSGILRGYIELLPSSDLSGTPGWDTIPNDLLGWDFPAGVTSKTFEFTIEVTDGLYRDLSTYQLTVFPRSQLRADTTAITVDTTNIDMSLGLTVDTGVKHNPLIVTDPSELPVVRENTYLSFDVDAIDLDGDELVYEIYTPPVALTGFFDEQFVNGDSTVYITEIPAGGYINTGVYPKQDVTVLADNVTSTSSADNARQEYANGSNVKVLQTDGLWYDATITNGIAVQVTGNTAVSATAGDILTQPAFGANATVSAVSPVTGTIVFAGNLFAGNAGDFITQSSSGANAQLISELYRGVRSIQLEYISGNFDIGSGNIAINGSNIDAYPTSVVCNTEITAIYNNSNIFIIGSELASANAFINSVNTETRFTEIVAQSVSVNGLAQEGQFGFDETKFSQELFVAPGGAITGRTFYVAAGSSGTTLKVESTAGAEPGLFAVGEGLGSILILNVVDSTTLILSAAPGAVLNDGQAINFTRESTITIDSRTGWLTGQLPVQTISQIVYDFEIQVYKKNFPEYQDQQLYSLTVLGDLNNQIEWQTDNFIGSIENGAISDLAIEAVSTAGSQLVYEPAIAGSFRLPQGLRLDASGLIIGRVSFSLFSLDQGATTIDRNSTTFDHTYSFDVTARDLARTVSSTRTFSIRVIARNMTPYENLYLRALTSLEQRNRFRSLMQDQQIFAPELIYRSNDPYYGLATDIKTLFLPGLNPSTLADYVKAAETNHFTKRIVIDGIGTAAAIDDNFDVKYEVVYLKILDTNSTKDGRAPADIIDLTNRLETPYYDQENNQFTVAYPNAFGNMSGVVADQLGYANKGALPAWMTSKQADGRILGFTRAVVLAYTVPGAAETVAYRLANSGFEFNQIDFSVDRYQLDNSLSDNFDIEENRFKVSKETTFDRYPATASTFNPAGTVNYAVSTAFSLINQHTVGFIRSNGGLDGINDFADGDRLVFAQQEFFLDQTDIGSYDQGWNRVDILWDDSPWDDDNETATVSDDQGWDQGSPVPGFVEHSLDSDVVDQRIGIWEISVDAETDIVTLTSVQEIEYYDTVFVRNGNTYGRSNIYYDPIVKAGSTLPNYSVISENIDIQGTTFDGNGTRFFNFRDSFSAPNSGDKYIKFTKTNVFT